MNEKALTVLEQYDLNIKGTYRTKGNYGCTTDEGKYLLMEYNNSNEKMVLMSTFYEYLEKAGFVTDSVIANKEGVYVSISEDGYAYILKKWFDGEDCNNTNRKHLLLTVENLAKFHNATENTTDIFKEQKFHKGRNLLEVMNKHSSEILRIKNYIKKRKNKNAFEMYLQNIIEEYYIQSVEALGAIKNSRYEQLYKESIASETIYHGSYNYHNVLIKENKIIMINMMKISYSPSVQDLYDFIRKVLEKNNWNIALGNELIKAYDSVRKLSDMERAVLKSLLSYPEKFWKIINYYYNSNKAWYSEKNEDKLKQFRKMEKLRRKFIENIG